MESVSETSTGPSESDRRIIEDFFMEHCHNSHERLGRLDVDCWTVTRRLVTFLSEINDHDSSQTPRRVRWVIHKPTVMLREHKRPHPIKRRIAQIFRRRLPTDDDKSRNEKSRQKRHRLSNYHTTSTVIETFTISHWVVEWKGSIIDPTVMQFVELDSILDGDDADKLRKRCYNETISFKSCSDIHPPWVNELVSRGDWYREYVKDVVVRPYFFGKENEHPIRCHAEVIKLDTKNTQKEI